MISQQTLDTVRPTTRIVSKATFVGHVTDLILPDAEAPVPRPQAFLVEQTANWTLPTHFHLEHQFQIFVAGGGSLPEQRIESCALARWSRATKASPISRYVRSATPAPGTSRIPKSAPSC